MPKLIKNSAKPIKGAIAAVVTYVALKLGLEVDPDAAAGFAGTVFAFVVRYVYPIFGSRQPTPEVR